MKISKARLQKYKDVKLINLVTKMCLTSATLALHEEFGFGSERLNKFSERFTKIMNSHAKTYDDVAYEALIKHAKECGVNIEFD